ncbi:MAG: proline--tRNA ligase, partial [Chloroflexota bacterium]
MTKTLREVPTDADTVSHQLLLRAGFIAPLAAGVYSYLPLGWRVLRKIEDIIRQEMDAIGGQELQMASLQPVELWQESGRFQSFGRSLFTLSDRRDRQLLLGPTHEEVVTQIARHYIKSYRDLPQLVYQFQTKFRDEPRPRGGLLRVREFIMKDLYSFDADEAGLERSYQAVLEAYRRAFDRCGLPSLMVEADSGAIGGKDSHEFILLNPAGEDEVVSCPNCGYAADREKAIMHKGDAATADILPVEEVVTPGVVSIADLSRFLSIPASQTLKSVFYVADGVLVFVALRGDLEVNEVKLRNALHCTELRLANATEVRVAGLVAGSASPLGLQGIKRVVDDSVTLARNLVAGGNKPNVHVRNVNYPRDFQADILADIALAGTEMSCARCSGNLLLARGIEVGHVFKLGIFLSEKLGAFYLDSQSTARPLMMGCYGIGLGRLLAAAVEHSHDEKGIIWPQAIAPYQVYLCPLHMDHPPV